MYSRYYPHDTASEIRVPAHYGGCAFPSDAREKKEAPHFFEVAKPSPPPEAQEKEARELPSIPDVAEEKKDPSPCEKSCSAPAPHPRPLSPLSRLFGASSEGLFSRGLDFDQLLLLGLILLLLGDEDNTELILSLALLLFCAPSDK